MDNEEIKKLIELPKESISNIAKYFPDDDKLPENIRNFIIMYQGPIEEQQI